jgi:NAD(P)-dependent dehydrogenase (short-subunit alcohol dehydrogenase family)
MEQGRVAVIFGGASGIGLGVAKLCRHKIGMKVAIADISQDALNKAEKELVNGSNKDSLSLLLVQCDATNEKQVKAFADQIYQKWNDVGFLFNNTGIMRADSAYNTSLEDWKRVMSVTFDATVVGTHIFVPRMLTQANKDCVIVNTSSIAGLMNSSESTGTPYTVAKFASRVFSESLALELRNTKISVHCLCPGPVNTNLLVNSKSQNESFAFESSSVGINEELLSRALSPDFVAEKLYEGVKNKNFYIVVTAKTLPKQILAEMMRFVADDVERGSIALSYVAPSPERKQEINARYAKVLQGLKKASL